MINRWSPSAPSAPDRLKSSSRRQSGPVPTGPQGYTVCPFPTVRRPLSARRCCAPPRKCLRNTPIHHAAVAHRRCAGLRNRHFFASRGSPLSSPSLIFASGAGILVDEAMSSENTAAIAALQKNWSQMKDVDRARAVRKIHQDGTSLRALANDLNCSPTLLRHLNMAALAPTSDQILARQGKISTLELARRGSTAADQDASKQRGALECKHMQEAQKISKAICEWLETEGLSGGHGEQIVDEARRLLADAEATHQLPHQVPPRPALPCKPLSIASARRDPPTTVPSPRHGTQSGSFDGLLRSTRFNYPSPGPQPPPGCPDQAITSGYP